MATASALALSVACQPSAVARVEPQDAPVEVRCARAERRELARSVTATGSLRAEETVVVAAKIAGRVLTVHADFGDAVAADALLLVIDPTDAVLLRQEAEQALLQALAVLGLEVLPPSGFEPDATPQVQKAMVARDLVALRAQRAERLAGEQPPVISEQELDDARAALQGGEAELALQRQSARAAFAQARLLEARLLTAEQRLADTAHRVPGTEASPAFRVGARLAAAGEYVALGAPLFRLVDGDPLRLRALLPERHLARITPGQSVAVRVESDAVTHAGVVARVAPEVDEATRSFEVEIRVPNPGDALKPGSFATAEIRTGSEPALMIPLACVRRFAGVHKVLRVVDGKAEERRVELGAEAGEWVEVRAGVAPEDLLILAPEPTLVTGAAVRVAAPGEADASAR